METSTLSEAIAAKREELIQHLDDAGISQAAYREPIDEIVQIYELRFKTKGYAKDMPFEATSLGEAIRMAKDWCLINGYMFINVSPFCHDIAGDLKKHRRASGL